jgi:ankyrin repeat protein
MIQVLEHYIMVTVKQANGANDTIYIPNNLNMKQQKEYLIKRNAILRDLFTENQTINQIDGLGFTPLHYAASTNSPSMIDLLTSFGAKPYKSNNDFALQPDAIAAITGADLLIPKLMNLCGRENLAEAKDFSLLAYYSYFGKDLRILDQIYNFNFGTATLNAVDKFGNSLAFYAALANNPQFLEYYIKDKLLDPNMSNADGFTMLIYAVQFNYEPIAKILLRLNAKPNIQDFSRKTALSYAMIKQDYNLAMLLIKHGGSIDVYDRQNMSPLFYAIQSNNPYALDIFLNLASITHIKTPDGYNPLNFALYYGYWSSALYIIAKLNVNINETTQDGLTPLMLASGSGQTKIVKALLDKGADPNIKSKTNNTALFYALNSRDPDNIATLLIEYGADAFIINKDNMTVAGYAGIHKKNIILLAIINNSPALKLMMSQHKLDELSLNLCTYLDESYFAICLYNVKSALENTHPGTNMRN